MTETHSSWYLIGTIGSLAIFCAWKAWKGFIDDNKTPATVALSQSFLIYAVLALEYTISMYLYKSTLFPSINRDSFILWGFYWETGAAFVGGIHGIINRKLINKTWHFWISVQLLIMCGMLVLAVTRLENFNVDSDRYMVIEQKPADTPLTRETLENLLKN